ncbi:tetratricopeptide repeat protein [Porphyrobacter sp. AAP60]|uniref:tetratricopeptide repeat protein n=1 Tax=Porphyrobacter sp. AAP60 TaxID=1523423 RepID=UPI0012E1F66D|nr:hypothetical protein [Porphyrobacter sp. AAP60]
MSSPEDAAARTPIIVEGRRDDPPPRAQTGSRIPSQPLFKDLSVSTSTGVAGLTPGSGMTPDGDRVHKRTTRSCSSSSKDVGKQASCLLLQAQAARLQNEIPEATDIYRFLVSSEQFNPAERLAGGTELHNLAKSTGNETLREEALIRLLDSKVLDEVQQASARRTLVDLALQRGDKPLAVERLEQHVADEDADAQSVANLAILRRESGASGATALMRRAIDSITAIGGDVPQGWLDFVAANAPE